LYGRFFRPPRAPRPAEYLYPLEEIDTVRTKENRTGLLEIITQEGTIEHAKLLRIKPLQCVLSLPPPLATVTTPTFGSPGFATWC